MRLPQQPKPPRLQALVLLLLTVGQGCHSVSDVKFRALFQREDGSSLPEFVVGSSSNLAEACSAYVTVHGFPQTAADCIVSLQQRYDMVVSSKVPAAADEDPTLVLFPDIRGAAVRRDNDRETNGGTAQRATTWWSGAKLGSCQDRAAVVALAAIRSSRRRTADVEGDVGQRQRRMVVVEIGAHDGEDTAVYAALASVGSVVAYEPTPTKGDAIRARTAAAATKNEARVVVREAAVSNESLAEGVQLFTPDPTRNDMANSLVNTSFVFG